MQQIIVEDSPSITTPFTIQNYNSVHINNNQIHVQALALNRKLSPNYVELRRDAKVVDIARLEDKLARSKASKAWTQYETTHGTPLYITMQDNITTRTMLRQQQQNSNAIPDGWYRIVYRGPGVCNNKYLSYDTSSEKTPGRVYFSSSTSMIWEVTSIPNSNTVTFEAIHRPQCCSGKLRYNSPNACTSTTVDLETNRGLVWTMTTVNAANKVVRLDAANRLQQCDASAGLSRLGPLTTSTSGSCTGSIKALQLHRRASTHSMTWQFIPVPMPPTPSPPPEENNDMKGRYKTVLNMTMVYYMIQRAGEIPPNYPVSWIYTSMLTDPVQPGFYDAGDTLKLNFPLSGSVSFLAWGLVDLHDTYQKLGVLDQALSIVRPAVEYLLNSYIGYRQYVGQISEPDVDHKFWGRPSQYPINEFPRFPFVWNETTKRQADLLGSVAAALASSSMAYRDADPEFAGKLKDKAVEIWQWGTVSEGLYSSVYPVATKAYPSTDWADDMAWGAAWLYRVTGNRTYLDKALYYWGRQDPNVYACWDSKYGPTAAMLTFLSHAGVDVPGIQTYASWLQDTFLRAWLVADGFWSIIRTPKGLTMPSWSKWGNLRYANTAGMVVAMHARTNPNATEKAMELEFARSQIDYALGSSGRSYVTGFDPEFPLRVHHAGASCPDMPKTCDWAQYSSPFPNPQILVGGMVGGPEGPLVNPIDPDASYVDERSNFAGNEVAVDYVSALTTVLVSVLESMNV